MNLHNAPKLLLAFVFVVAVVAAGDDAGKPTTVKGYVLDSACAFTKGLKKPISKECAVAPERLAERCHLKQVTLFCYGLMECKDLARYKRQER